MQRTDYTRTLAEKLRKNADTAFTVADIKYGIGFVHSLPCMRRKQQQTVCKEFHERVKHSVGTAFNIADCFHG